MWITQYFTIFISITVLDVCLSAETGNTSTPVDEGRTYHGLIREDAAEGTVVELDTALIIGDSKGPVCGFTVFKSGTQAIPFQVILTDPKSGQAQIVLARGQRLNYEHESLYQFNIATDDCVTGEHSSVRSNVIIGVEDVNDFSPVWKQSSLMIEAVEGILYKRLVRLEATDGDGTEAYSRICKYILLTEDVPFTIDELGYLQNTEPLDYSVKHNFILEVVAEDCGHQRSDRLLVNIIVKPECKIGWAGIKNSIDYSISSRRVELTDNATLDLCGAVCHVKEARVSIKLIPEHKEPRECARDKTAISTRNTFCEASKDTIDLLPELTNHKPESNTTTDLKDQASTLDLKDNVFSFDGRSMAYDMSVDKFSGRLGKKFTIATWLRHEEETAEREEIKQHIVCQADEEGMNRHHYSLFLHNCRLILLLRQEPGEGVDLNVFNPAEWRWRLNEVCDGKWHHYAVSVDYPNVRLYIDGKIVVPSKHHPDIIDDWPIHPSKKAKGTKFTVGACWEGAEHRHGQHLRGDLAGLTILNNATEGDHVIQCINTCSEKLDFHAVAEMDAGMSISMNSEMSQLSITGHAVESVVKLLNRIGYVNSHDAAKASSSNTLITYDTSVTCSDDSTLSVGTASTVITLLSDSPPPSTTPTLTVSASTQLTRTEKELQAGVTLFSDLVIFFSHPLVVSKSDVDKLNSEYTLSSCIVHVEPKLEENSESMSLESHIPTTLQARLDPYGLTLQGIGSVGDYLTVLRGLIYKNKRSEDLTGRSVSLMCTAEPNTKTTSNQLIVQLSVVHESYKAEGKSLDDKAAHVEISRHDVEQSRLKSDEKFIEEMDRHSSGAGLAVIAVVCGGFVLFLVVVGVMRARGSHSRVVEVEGGGDRQEMEWDNSAITITVNPMERDEQTVYEETELTGLQAGVGDVSDSDDDIGSFHDDGPNTSDDDDDDDDDDVRSGRALKDDDKGLEWDNSHTEY